MFVPSTLLGRRQERSPRGKSYRRAALANTAKVPVVPVLTDIEERLLEPHRKELVMKPIGIQDWPKRAEPTARTSYVFEQLNHYAERRLR